ncbi:hypothetical protein PVK06_038941 [Gossypium arboreum]|uniref:Uncharacterized protein n=1 Tax=Gossypium arboreum TaxID=29729 RepID=A0ABR0N1H0_GOSAR|nr:hypothetical protein PVK06_038941 [Gossypium arboreum]
MADSVVLQYTKKLETESSSKNPTRRLRPSPSKKNMNEQEEGTKKLNVNTSANQLFFESQSRADEVGQKWFDGPGDLS